MRCTPAATLLLILSSAAACRQSAPPAEQAQASQAPRPTPAAQPAPTTPPATDAGAAPAPSRQSNKFGSLLDALGLGGRRPIPEDLILGGDCPDAGPGADEEIAAQAAARVPLIVGLTLTNLWNPTPEEEYECLNQVVKIDRNGIEFTVDCNHPRKPETLLRRTCRSDLRNARMLHTAVGVAEVIDASGEPAAETVVGATEWSLSGAAFAELKRTGATRHHYVQIGAQDRLAWEATADLRLEGTGTAPVTMNNTTVEVPVLRASGEASLWMMGREAKGRVTALILDDERFPLLVDYAHITESAARPDFRLYFPKVSFPGDSRSTAASTAAAGTEGAGIAEGGGGAARGGGGGAGGGEMERQLADNKRVDVYGIYFAFASDRIRKESAPILKEIADMLGRNPDWTLTIDGHTDNIGGDTYNLDLSRRRSEAVRKALVERFAIAASRLTTAGHGASAPKDTNDTPEGRARNRRVELVRR